MADLANKFVSETEVEEKKKKRQEEWEKVRRPDQPEEAPEEEYDPRSLYDRLQEQKTKKDEEFEEAHRLKNQIRGLDEEETDFLDYVSDRQRDIQKAKMAEDEEVLNEYRNSVSNKVTVASPKEPVKPTTEKKTVPTSKKSSQQKLLAGAVKRKSTSDSNTDASNGDSKKAKTVDAITVPSAAGDLPNRGHAVVVG